MAILQDSKRRLMNYRKPGKHHIVVLMGLLALMILGCRSQRNVAGDRSNESGGATRTQMSSLDKNKHQFKTLKARKVYVDLYMNGGHDKVKGNIAIYRDSLIAVSIVPALGYEILRILCTRDSVIVINRPAKSYYASSFEQYRNKYRIPVDFTDLQSILVNEVFYYKEDYADRIITKKRNRKENKSLYVLDGFRAERQITSQGIEFDETGISLVNVVIEDYDINMRLGINYEEFSAEGEILFPGSVKLDLVDKDNSIKLKIEYGQVIFDDSLRIEFAAPLHYTREKLFN